MPEMFFFVLIGNLLVSKVFCTPNGQAKPQWADGTTTVQRNVDAADESGKTVEPIVGLSAWLGGAMDDPTRRNHLRLL